MKNKLTVVRRFFDNDEDKGKVVADLNSDGLYVAIYIMCPILNAFSLVFFIKALNYIKANIDPATLVFPYLSDGVLEKSVEQKLITGVLDNFKIEFDYE